MKRKRSVFFKTLFAAAATMAAFILVGAGMISFEQKEVDSDIQKVPYYEEQCPEFCGIFINFSEGGSVYVGLDYGNKRVCVIRLPAAASAGSALDYGYSADYEFEMTYDALAGFIDRFDGLILDTADGTMRHTGVQVCALLARTTEKQFINGVISGIFEKISAKGFTQKDLIYIIENSDTNMSYPQGYNLIEMLPEISKNLYFIN